MAGKWDGGSQAEVQPRHLEPGSPCTPPSGCQARQPWIPRIGDWGRAGVTCCSRKLACPTHFNEVAVIPDATSQAPQLSTLFTWATDRNAVISTIFSVIEDIPPSHHILSRLATCTNCFRTALWRWRFSWIYRRAQKRTTLGLVAMSQDNNNLWSVRRPREVR
jgi:hypothetical protein